MPPLESIEIFVAAARGDSFRAVAKRLALSPSAVSRRIAALEAFLGVELFERLGQAQRLSVAGERYVAAVAPAIRAIERAGTEIVVDHRGSFTIAASHSLATGWLMPRLAAAQEVIGMEIELLPTRDPEVLRSGLAEVAIWGDMEPVADLAATPLFDGVAVAVAGHAHAGPRRLSDSELLEHPLLGVHSPGDLWDRWLALPPTFDRQVRTRDYPTVQLMYEAAAAGAGIALAMPLVAEPYLRSGRLVPVGSGCRAISSSYQLFRRHERTGTRRIHRRFDSWLQDQVSSSLQAFARLTAA